jgi:uncharacterized protein YgiM (DUF1202 family)
MKRLLLTAVLLLMAFMVLPVEEAAAQTGATATVTAWHLNVRDYPDPVVGNVIARIGRGEVYEVTARSSINHWWQLRLPDGRLGWVDGSFIHVVNAHLAPSLDPRVHVPDSARATVTAWHLNVRDYPDPVVGNVIARIGRGEVYEVTARSSINHWWQLRLPDGRLGWVSGTFIQVTNSHLAPSLDPRAHVPDSARGSVTASHLNVRHIPNPFTGEIIARVGRGEVYPVVGRNADSSWWQIRLPDTRTGWVNGRYLTLTNAHLVPVTDHTTPTPPAPVPAPTITGTVVGAHLLNVRTAPSMIFGGIMAVIGQGQTYTTIGRNFDSSWWQIRIGNTTGWVSGRFFSVPGGHTLPVTG